MQIVKITKAYKKMKPGDTPNVDDLYAAKLIKKGVAVKSDQKGEKK